MILDEDSHPTEEFASQAHKTVYTKLQTGTQGHLSQIKARKKAQRRKEAQRAAGRPMDAQAGRLGTAAEAQVIKAAKELKDEGTHW